MAEDARKRGIVTVRVVADRGDWVEVEVEGAHVFGGDEEAHQLRLTLPAKAVALDEAEQGDSAEPARPTPASPKHLARDVAEALLDHAPPKIEGGSPARAQWLADVLAVEIAMHEHGLLDEFADELLG